MLLAALVGKEEEEEEEPNLFNHSIVMKYVMILIFYIPDYKSFDKQVIILSRSTKGREERWIAETVRRIR